MLFRKQEVSLWQPSSKKKAGWVSQYGELKGLKNLKSRKVADFTPYAVARTDRFEKETDNPFKKSGRKNQLDFGLDGKVGLTNNLTLDFTINPDFGQVEADPSQVNLTSFETFFQEKRPFFIEGKNILSYPLMFGDGDLASENIFYSRRIGRRPHNSPELEDGEYIDAPEFTSILGAAKVTGKTKTGWSVGLLESLTSKEFAHISNGHQRTELIEPFTNYSIGRVQKDFNNGNTLLGGIFTSVNRKLDEAEVDYLHKSAYTGGIDFVHKWHNKDWEFDFSSYFSTVEGGTEAIKNTQESWIHGASLLPFVLLYPANYYFAVLGLAFLCAGAERRLAFALAVVNALAFALQARWGAPDELEMQCWAVSLLLVGALAIGAGLARS
jgi:hypothetical protein